LFHVKRDRSSPLEILRLAFAKVYFKDNIARIFGCISCSVESELTTGYSHERTPPNEKLYFRESKVAESKAAAPGGKNSCLSFRTSESHVFKVPTGKVLFDDVGAVAMKNFPTRTRGADHFSREGPAVNKEPP